MSHVTEGNRVVFVVSFRGEGAGGFDWFYKEECALRRYEQGVREAADDEAKGWPSLIKYIGARQVPEGTADEITDYLDENWDLWDFPAPWDNEDWDREEWRAERAQAAQGVQS